MDEHTARHLALALDRVNASGQLRYLPEHLDRLERDIARIEQGVADLREACDRLEAPLGANDAEEIARLTRELTRCQEGPFG